MPTAGCRSRPRAPANITALPRQCDPDHIVIARRQRVRPSAGPMINSATKIPWGWIAARSEARLRLQKPLNLETTMLLDHPSDEPTAIRTHIGAIFVSLELSRSTWLVTSLLPGKGEKMSKYSITAGDMAELLTLFAELRRKAEVRTG